MTHYAAITAILLLLGWGGYSYGDNHNWWGGSHTGGGHHTYEPSGSTGSCS